MGIEILGALAGAWAWEQYGKDFVDKVGGKLSIAVKGKWEKFNWKKAAEQYRQEMHRQHSTIRILGKAEPVPLEGIYTDIYILRRC